MKVLCRRRTTGEYSQGDARNGVCRGGCLCRCRHLCGGCAGQSARPFAGHRLVERTAGLYWRYLEYKGTGAKPTVADRVTVHYAGTFIDGETFDSSYDRGEPVTFPLGRLVKAWQMAIPEMRVGEAIEIAAPADLAYGAKGKGPIPGGATLVFKVELLDIEGQ